MPRTIKTAPGRKTSHLKLKDIPKKSRHLIQAWRMQREFSYKACKIADNGCCYIDCNILFELDNKLKKHIFDRFEGSTFDKLQTYYTMMLNVCEDLQKFLERG